MPDIIEGVIVVDKNEPENLKLRAFVLSNVNKDVTKNMQQYFQGKLPHYMCPASITIVNEFPLTENAKIDKALLKHFVDSLLQRLLLLLLVSKDKKIWQKVLKKMLVKT